MESPSISLNTPTRRLQKFLPFVFVGTVVNCGYVSLDLVDESVRTSGDGDDGSGGDLTTADPGDGDSAGDTGDRESSGGASNGDGDGDGDGDAPGGASSGGVDGSGGRDDGAGGDDGSGGVPAGGGGANSGGDSGDGGGWWGGGGDRWGGGGDYRGGGGGWWGNSGGSGGQPSEVCVGGETPDFSLVGWATQAGGTTGGKGGTTVTVTTGSQLISALQNKSANTPLTILVNGTITQANSFTDKIDVKDVRNVSIIGVANRGVFNGIGLKLWKTGNVVLRNLRIHHVAAGEGDAVSIAGPADHIWVDHCDFYSAYQGVDKETYDGLIDAKDQAEYITYSWNHFHDHWTVNLVGSSESDTYDRKLTMHHNWFENISGDAPSFRGGQGHIFNNYYEDVGTMAINSRLGACLLVENNVFSNVVNPWVTAYSDVDGGVELVCNDVDAASSFDYSQEISEAPSCDATVPYQYAQALNHTSVVESLVTGNVGIGIVSNPQIF